MIPGATTATIRDAREEDLARIAGIYAVHVLHGAATFEVEPPGRDEMSRRRRALVDDGFPYLVAVLEGVVVGYAYAGAYRTRYAYRFTVEDSIYLDPAVAGRGIGTRLLEELIARCEARGDRQMIAVIGDSANLGSIRVHARCGFRPVGTLEATGFKLGRWVDSVLMQRALGSGSTRLPEAGR